jgi:nicotinamide-nucleotide amidase
VNDPLCDALGLDFAFVAGVVRLLAERGETVATAESLTAGLVAAALTTVPGASAVVRGGLVVYATDLKDRLAGVPAELLAAHGAVHPDVASALASGARTVCGADWGLGLTGVAGPDPQDGVTPGTVYFGIAQSSGTTTVRLDLAGDRHRIRAGAVGAVVHGLYTALTT